MSPPNQEAVWVLFHPTGHASIDGCPVVSVSEATTR